MTGDFQDLLASVEEKRGRMATRAQLAGKRMADAVIGMVHLIRQDREAIQFLKILVAELNKEIGRRGRT